MGKFNNRGSGRKRSDGFGTAGKHRAVCANCGKDCEVPFKPSGDRPIYCSICFGKEDGGNLNRKDKRSYDSSERRDMFSATCAECGKKCEIPFRPRSGKAVYCSSCFEKVDPNRESKDRREGGGTYEKSKSSFDMSLINDQLISVNVKLDKLINILTPAKKEDGKEKETAESEDVTEKIKKAVKKPKSAVKKSVAKKKPEKKETAKKTTSKKKKEK